MKRIENFLTKLFIIILSFLSVQLNAQELYYAFNDGINEISVYKADVSDLSDTSLVTSFNTLSSPSLVGFKLDNDNNRLFLKDDFSSEVVSIDLQTGSILDSTNIGSGISTFSYADGELFTIYQEEGYKFNTNNYGVRASPVISTCDNFIGGFSDLKVDYDGTTLYNTSSNEIAFYDYEGAKVGVECDPIATSLTRTITIRQIASDRINNLLYWVESNNEGVTNLLKTKVDYSIDDNFVIDLDAEIFSSLSTSSYSILDLALDDNSNEIYVLVRDFEPTSFNRYGVLRFNITPTSGDLVSTTTFQIPLGEGNLENIAFRPAQPDPLIVTNALDDGSVGSLRNAVEYADTHEGPDTITFDAGIDGQTIILGSQLDLDNDSTVVWGDLDGDSLPDFTIILADTIANGIRIFDLNFSADYNHLHALNLQSGDTSKFHTGISITGKNNKVTSSYIGINLAGTDSTGLTSFKGSGVSINGDSNQVGNASSFPNVISGNGNGISVTGDYTKLFNNYIGVDKDGIVAIPNSRGLNIGNSSGNNLIGDDSYPNIISGNTGDGVFLYGDNNTLVNNYIGVDKNGTTAIPNGITPTTNSRYGLQIWGENNQIGELSSLPNIISGNNQAGIYILSSSYSNTIENNYIGVDINGTTAIPNQYGIQLNGDSNIVNANVASGNQVGFLVFGDNNTFTTNHVGVDKDGLFAIPNTSTGIQFNGGSYNNVGDSLTLPNIISGNSTGIMSNGQNIILNNYIGLNKAGTDTIPNTQYGIEIRSDSNQIGGSTASGRNIISGNGSKGIILSSNANYNVIANNYIGTDVSGTISLGNNDGILTTGDFNYIGDTLFPPNVISGNIENGIFMNSKNNTVINNYIGTDATGLAALQNNNTGVLVQADSNTIGGSFLYPNVLSGNARGVYLKSLNNIVSRNAIGIGVDGSTAVPNTVEGILIDGQKNIIEENIIAYNNISGIHLTTFSPVADSNTFNNNNKIYGNGSIAINMAAGAHAGVQPAIINTITPDGFIQGTASPNATIYFYTDSSDQAQEYLSEDFAVANSSGEWELDLLDYFDFELGTTIGNYVASTGLDSITVLQDSAGQQSALSNAFKLEVPPCDSGFVVNTQDGGCGSLPLAVEYANNHPGPDTIRFDPSLIGDTIEIGFDLQLDSSGTYISGDINDDGIPDITLIAASGGDGNSIFHIGGAAKSCHIDGFYLLDDDGIDYGILLQGDSCKVTGCIIGIDAGGNSYGFGQVGIGLQGLYNTIGGSDSTDRNVISSNNFGIFVDEPHNLVYGNYIGTTVDGSSERANTSAGIVIDNPHNLVGDTLTGIGNVIVTSSTLSAAISTTTDSAYIVGNSIGFSADGMTSLGGNIGIYVDGGDHIKIGGKPEWANYINSTDSAAVVIANDGGMIPLTNFEMSHNLIGILPADSSFVSGAIGVFFDAGDEIIDLSENTIANQSTALKYSASADRIKLNQNSIYNNTVVFETEAGFADIRLASPTDLSFDFATNTLSGTYNISGRTVQVFADAVDQGQQYLTSTTTLADSTWSVSIDTSIIEDGLSQITAMADDSLDLTSRFSLSACIADPLLVINTQDGGCGSLFEALQYADNNTGPDTIRFDPSLMGDTIKLSTSLFINSSGTYVSGDIDENGSPDIVLQVTTNFVTAFSINGANSTHINGFNIINSSANSAEGISIDADSVTITSCIIGTDISGTATDLGFDIGIAIRGKYALIGGGSSFDRNVISGNTFSEVSIGGITNGSDYTKIIGNYVGINASGTAANSQLTEPGFGAIYVDNNDNIQIGDTTTGIGNIIVSNNNSNAIAIVNTDSTYITGNYINFTVDGSQVIGNGIGINSYRNQNLTIGGREAWRNYIISPDTSSMFFEDGSTDNLSRTTVSNYGISYNTIGQRPSDSFAVSGKEGIRFVDTKGVIELSQNIITNQEIGIVYTAIQVDSVFLEVNSIFDNGSALAIDFGGGPMISGPFPPTEPTITTYNRVTNTVSGTTDPNALVQVFADKSDQGELYMGQATADGSGNFSFVVDTNLIPTNLLNLTTTSTIINGTSIFSSPFCIGDVVSAGDDLFIACQGSEVQLNADSIFTGAGMWRDVSSYFPAEAPELLINIGDPLSTVSGFAKDTTYLEWEATAGACVTKDTVAVIVAPTVAVEDELVITEVNVANGDTLDIFPLLNDTLAANSSYLIGFTSPSSTQSLLISGGGSTANIAYQPRPTFTGTDTLGYIINTEDAGGMVCESSTSFIVIRLQAGPITAIDDNEIFNLNAECRYEVDILANDDTEAVDINDVALAITRQPINGTAFLDNNFLYYESLNSLKSTDTIEYSLTYTDEDTTYVEFAEVSLTFNIPTIPIIAENVFLDSNAFEDQFLVVDILDSISYDITQPVTIEILDGPFNGKASVQGDTLISILPKTFFYDRDSLQYRISYSCIDSADTAWVSYKIGNNPPVAREGNLNYRSLGLVIDMSELIFDRDNNISEFDTLVGPRLDSLVEVKISKLDQTIEIQYQTLNRSRHKDSLQYYVCDEGDLCDTNWVFYTLNIDEPIIYNAISPNDDDRNSYMRVDNLKFYTYNRVQVFSRENTPVYDKEGYDNENVRWDGKTPSGEVLNPGSYLTILKYGSKSNFETITTYVILKSSKDL